MISVVADSLTGHRKRDNVLFLSEDGFDLSFTAARALSRNRVIHSLGELTLVAQSGYQVGGTWGGTVRNLRFGWSPVYCFRDESPAQKLLVEMGAQSVDMQALEDLNGLTADNADLFSMND